MVMPEDKELDEQEEHPQNVQEWLDWVNTLEGDDFLNKADAANSGPFVEMLREEEYNSQEIGMILYAFAKRHYDIGIDPPRKRTGDYRGYLELVETYEMFDMPTTPEELEAVEEN